MARKRLQPADPAEMFRARNIPADLEAKSLFRLSPQPPIAQVAAEASASAALEEVSRSLAEARDSGRMVLSLPLASILPDHLLRDRILAEDEDMAALKQSIRDHGQRHPIDVTALPAAADGSPRWGLISGWRRLKALQDLLEETGAPRFASIAALVRRPESAAAAYVAMIEENEIRAALSHYERARIVALAVESGVFAHDREALQALFGNVSRAKRSKIGTFIGVWRALDSHLRFPAAIGERLGLRLAAAIAAGRGPVLVAALAAAEASDASAEQAVLDAALSRPLAGGSEIAPGVVLTVRGRGLNRRLTLSGTGVVDALIARVTAAARG